MIKRTKINMMLIIGLLLTLILAGCDNTDYKTRIQQENDRKNYSGNKSACLIVGNLRQNDYPYTIKYLVGEIDPKNPHDKIDNNNWLNIKLSLFAKEGLFTEEVIGYDGDKPLYRYDLTDEGRKYVDWWGGTNFCFGRIVVDSIRDVENSQDGDNLRRVYFLYHLENIPTWVQNKAIYSMYPGYGDIEAAVTGKQARGTHYYRFNSNNELKLIRRESGIYVP
ncbi:hypothetical protein RHO13_08115 [Orbus wheelerorum]|uniref:hypothetical protein n=1 Tax=Orbus wheelerorum TaxID=3074111 RepID=UPI00370D88A7